MIENPILKGFCPDPSIIRVGEDYYIATSTFEWWPGVKLHHSKDLKHWTQIQSPINRPDQLNMEGNPPSGGVWAPCLSWDNGIFYLIYTDVKTKKDRYYNTHNYLIQSEDIEGDWSEPVYLNSTGFDPSLFHDIDGKKYLVNMRNGFKGILLQEYDSIGKSLIGESKMVYSGTKAGFTEGPHLYHIGDWYYLIVAEGGTGYGHCVTVARAKNVWGPYETDPNNPMMRASADDSAYLQKCGHADLVETEKGEWYMVHLCARPQGEKKACLLGRETAIQKVYWNQDGWLRLENGGYTAERYVEESAELQFAINKEELIRDDFNGEVLDVRYVSPRIPLGKKASLSDRKGYLRLYGQESMNSLHKVTLAAVRQTDIHAAAQTGVEFYPKYSEQAAGLAYMYDALNFYIFGKTVDAKGQSVLTLIKSEMGAICDEITPIPLKEGKIHLKVEVDEKGEYAYFSYSYTGREWTEVPAPCRTKILTDEYCRGFTGAHFGMYCHDMTGQNLYADFDYFEVVSG